MQTLALRTAMRAGQRVYGTLVSAPSTLWIGTAQSAPLDFVFIDSEHIPNDRETLSWMCHGYRAIDLPPIVRVPSPDPYEACKVLDGGAAGVIFPYTETVEQMRHLVGACRYRPLKGQRLQDALDDPNSLEPELRDYLEKRNESSIAVANIESVPAIENLDALLAIDGLDAVLIGPHDLSCSLGIPEQYDHPRFDEAVRTIFGKARAAGKGAGIHYFQEKLDAEIEWIRAGGNFVVHAGDVHFYRQKAKADLDALRTAFGDDAQSSDDGVII